MGRHLASNGITLLIAFLVISVGMLEWGRGAFRDPGPLTEDAVVEVPSGANLDRVTRVLREAGAIDNAFVFRIGARMGGYDEQLKLGCYDVPAASSMRDILELVTTGSAAQACYRATFVVNTRGVGIRIQDAKADQNPGVLALEDGLDAVRAELEAQDAVTLRVAFAEGLTVREMLDGVAAVPFLQGEVPAPPPEGMLAPDTFEISEGGSRAELVDRMRALQERRLQAAWDNRAGDLPLQSAEELLTLASIIEKETGVAEERRTVGGVFVNRMRQGMRLQTDPTIIYGITRGQEPLGREISRSDIDGATERQRHGAVTYNTYQIDGLPPGPIANPGNAALQAAADPEATPFLFFVADGTGGHAFAETLEEHNRNVEAYRALQQESQ